MHDIQKSLVMELTQETAQQVIANFPQVLIVDFYADWCGPCKVMTPVFEEVALELRDKYTFAKINIDHNQALAQEYKIFSIPTIAIFSNNKLVDKITGQQSKETLLERIKQALLPQVDLSQLDQKSLNDKLFQAVQNRAELEDIKKIIAAGADVDAPSAQGLTPLMYVVFAQLAMGLEVTQLVQLLLDNGASTEFLMPPDNKKMDVLEYITHYIQRTKFIIQNCEKLVELLEKHKQPQHERACTSEGCSL